MDRVFAELAPLFHPVTIVLIILSVAASRSRVATGRRGWVLLIGIAVAIVTGTICARRDWLLQQLALVLHPVSVALLIIAGFAWFSSTVSRKRGFLVLLGLIVGVGVGELYGRWFLARTPMLQRQREVLRIKDDALRDQSMHYIPQPYLLYVPSPGYTDGENWHNQGGYRGHEFPLERTPGVARVLCLGGSTTYSWGTEDPDDAYPAVLEDLLNEKLPEGSRRVEVINGGLPNGTTAELVTHYHFKFQYFAPDVVVINTGGNDAHSQAKRMFYYQPDYSHWRQAFSAPQPLSPLGRSLLKSTFASWFILPLTRDATVNSTIGRAFWHRPPPTQWYPAAQEPGQVPSIPDDQLGFTRNLRRLIQMVKADGGEVVLVPFRVAPGGEVEEAMTQGERNERILKELARAKELPVAPFPQDCITSDNWVDSCHLNAAGCREKAEHIAPFVREVLSARSVQ